MHAAPQPDRRTAPIAAALLLLASDQRLVEHARAGSEAAFEALYHRHRRAVLAYCRRTLGSADDADDAMQQTFVAAYYGLDRLEQPVAMRAWLYGIARHRCQSVLRARNGGSPDSPPEPFADGLAAELVARHELRAVLADVAALPDDQRFAIIQAELGGVSHDQIARVLGCRHDKVKALIFQARASLTANRTARETPCDEIQHQLATLRGAALRRATLRRHLANCGACTEFRERLRGRRRSPRSLVPVFLLHRGVLGPLLGSTSETTLSAGAVGAGGLAATALAALALHGGAIVHGVAPGRDHATVAPVARSSGALTPTGQGAMPASSPALWGARFTHASPPPSRREASDRGPARAPKRPGGAQSPSDAPQPASTPAPDTTPGTDRPAQPDQSRVASESDKPTTAGEGTPAKRGGSAQADPQSSKQASEDAGADAQDEGPGPATAPPQAQPPNPRPAPQVRPPQPQPDAPHPAPAAPPAPSASHAAPPATPGVANAPDHRAPLEPEPNGPPAGHDPGPATPPAAAHSGGGGR